MTYLVDAPDKQRPLRDSDSAHVVSSLEPMLQRTGDLLQLAEFISQVRQLFSPRHGRQAVHRLNRNQVFAHESLTSTIMLMRSDLLRFSMECNFE